LFVVPYPLLRLPLRHQCSDSHKFHSRCEGHVRHKWKVRAEIF
jgi:hypothetical protein